MSPENKLTDVLAAIDAAQNQYPGVFAPLKVIEQIIGSGPTSVAGFVRSGRIGSLIIGNRRHANLSDTFDYLRERARASFGLDGEPLRIRTPSSMYKRKLRPPRERSAAELNALQRSNAERHRQAVQRKAEAEAKRQVREQADV